MGCHRRRLVGKLSCYQIAALALDMGGDVPAAFRAFYGIALLIAKPVQGGNQFGPLINADTSRDQTTSSPVTVLSAAFLVTAAQAVKQMPTKACIPIYPAIHRLDADAHPGVVRTCPLQACRNDIGRPVSTQTSLDISHQRNMGVSPEVKRDLPACQGLLVCALVPVNPGGDDRPVALDLAADGAVMATQPTGNFPQSEFK